MNTSCPKQYPGSVLSGFVEFMGSGFFAGAKPRKDGVIPERVGISQERCR